MHSRRRPARRCTCIRSGHRTWSIPPSLWQAVGAFTVLVPELALERAREAEQAVVEAADPGALPVLHGVVVPVKDLSFAVGARCRMGSVAYDLEPLADDNVVVNSFGVPPEFAFEPQAHWDLGPQLGILDFCR